MADSKLRIVIDAIADGARQELGAIARDLKATGAATTDLAANQKKAAFSFTELNSAISIGRQALGLMQQAYTAVIDPTIKYADEVRSLSREIGASAEETSKLIQAADDVFISTETLTAGLQAAIRKGYQPTIAGLGQMSDKYLSIQDPIERTKFLMDTFGRSGAALGPLMEKGAAGIDKMGDAAERAGQVLSGDDLKATLAYKEAVDALQDSWQGLTIALSRDAIPALTNVANTFGDALDVQARYNAVVKAGALTQQQKMQITLADEFGLRDWGLEALKAAEAQAKINDYLKMGTNAYSYMIPVVEKSTALTVALTGAYDSQIGKAIEVGGATDAYGTILQAAADKAGWLASQVRAAADANDAMLKSHQTWLDGVAGDLVSALDAAGIKGERYAAALHAIDDVYGTSKSDEANYQADLAAINAEFAKTGDVDAYEAALRRLADGGASEAAAKAEDAQNQVSLLNDAIYNLPADKHVNITVDHWDNWHAGGGA
ncbi:MAG: hypothetical protein ABI847_11510, partial [Anaerolineales bacterium]